MAGQGNTVHPVFCGKKGSILYARYGSPVEDLTAHQLTDSICWNERSFFS